MSQFMSNPTGAGFGNTMDPLSNLAALEKRKQEAAALQAEYAARRARVKARREEMEMANRPASVEAPPATPPTAPTAATTPNASTAASTGSAPSYQERGAPYDRLRKAAYERHGSEIGRMNEFATSGGYVPPLASKRAGQRLDNELRRIAAIQAQDESQRVIRENMIQRLNERQAAQAARRAQIAAQRSVENEDIGIEAVLRARDLTQTTEGVNYAAAEEAGNRAYLDRLLAQGYGDRPSPSAPLIEAAKRTPTAALSNLASSDYNPYEVADPVFGDPSARGPRRLLGEMGEKIIPLFKTDQDMNDIKWMMDPAFGDPSASGPPAEPQAQPLLREPQKPLGELAADLDPGQRAIVEEQLRRQAMLSGQNTLPPMSPESERASRIVSDRYADAPQVFPGAPKPYQDSELAQKYIDDVLLELRRTSGPQLSAPVVRTPGEAPSVLGTLGASVFGPGGLMGPALPPELVQREIARATTDTDLAAAQARQMRGEMQGATLDVLGGLAAAGNAPRGAAPTQPAVVQERTVRMPSPAKVSGPGNLRAGRGTFMDESGRPVRVTADESQPTFGMNTAGVGKAPARLARDGEQADPFRGHQVVDPRMEQMVRERRGLRVSTPELDQALRDQILKEMVESPSLGLRDTGRQITPTRRREGVYTEDEIRTLGGGRRSQAPRTSTPEDKPVPAKKTDSSALIAAKQQADAEATSLGKAKRKTSTPEDNPAQSSPAPGSDKAFVELNKRLARLQRAYETGAIDEKEYTAEVEIQRRRAGFPARGGSGTANPR